MRNGTQKRRSFRFTETAGGAFARIRAANRHWETRSDPNIIEMVLEEAVLAIEDYMDSHRGELPDITKMRLTASNSPTGSLRWIDYDRAKPAVAEPAGGVVLRFPHGGIAS